MTTFAGAPIRTNPRTPAPVRPGLCAAVFGVTLAVSLVALARPAVMDLFTRDHSQVRAGQWWRVVTPVLVQPDGWGQLGFNLLGVAVVGWALQRRVRPVGWLLIYLAGGSGSIAVSTAWDPHVTGGGSSAAVAALIGALAVSMASGRAIRGIEHVAQLYSVFFVVYLCALALGGALPSIIAGNASIIVWFAARRALSATALMRACLVVVLVGGILMTMAKDDHGTGILIGVALGWVVLACRRLVSRPGWTQRARQLLVAVAVVWAACVLTWYAWTQLLGLDLRVAQRGTGDRAGVGWLSVSAAAVIVCLTAALARYCLSRWWPDRGVGMWLALGAGVAVASISAPLQLAVGNESLAGLLYLHAVCALTTIGLLARSAIPDPAKSGTV